MRVELLGLLRRRQLLQPLRVELPWRTHAVADLARLGTGRHARLLREAVRSKRAGRLAYRSQLRRAQPLGRADRATWPCKGHACWTLKRVPAIGV